MTANRIGEDKTNIMIMDKVFYNGLISTVDSDNSFVDAVGIKDGKIAFTGTNEEACRIEAQERIDLNGKLMLPGFGDSHMHLLHFAYISSSVRLFDCTSAEDAVSKVREKFEATGCKLKGLYSRGWNEDKFTVSRYPTRSELDEISSDIPMIMVRVCGHIAVVNTCGIQRLKALPEYPEFASEVSEETGLIKENAVQYFHAILDAPTQEEIEEMIKFGISKLHECGITSVQSDDLASLPGKKWHRIIDSYRSLAQRGELKINYYEQCLFERFDDLKAFLSEGYKTGQNDGTFTIGPVKLIQDGSLGAKTAALNEPYEDEPDNTGVIIFDQKTLNDIFRLCDEEHMQVAVHCIGDRAMDMVLNAMENSPLRFSNPKNRHGIVHVQISNPHIIERMQKNHVLAYIQPVFIDCDMDIVESRIGKHRMEGIYAWKTLLDLGVHASGGSDAPVVSFNIMENIYFAVTRRNIHGQPEDGWIPEERLSVEEAVRLFTEAPAYASYQEDSRGTIEVGKHADLVILSDDIYHIDPGAIKDVKILETIFEGETVYKA